MSISRFPSILFCADWMFNGTTSWRQGQRNKTTNFHTKWGTSSRVFTALREGDVFSRVCVSVCLLTGRALQTCSSMFIVKHVRNAFMLFSAFKAKEVYCRFWSYRLLNSWGKMTSRFPRTRPPWIYYCRINDLFLFTSKNHSNKSIPV